MADPANGIVENLGFRESLVTTLVRKNPESGSKKALDDGVEGPESKSNRSRRNVLGSDESIEEVKGGCERCNISGNIVQPCNG